MPYVAIAPTSGLGNQLFMMAAALGYAERWGYEPVFWDEPASSWEHKGSRFRIRAMFPQIRVLNVADRMGEWVVIKESPDAVFTYTPLPNAGGRNVKLEGYFQSDFYGPSVFPTPPSPPALSAELIAHRWSNTFFLHVRRGDYLHPSNAHHAVDLSAYWRTCLALMDPAWTCFVVSDDMDWCRRELVGIVGDAWKGQWLFSPTDLSDVETFFWMRACGKGGICANSTFSWWAAWYVRQRVGASAHLYMPHKWGNAPMPPTRHLYPAWAIVK
jgi:hypothetical protein